MGKRDRRKAQDEEPDSEDEAREARAEAKRLKKEKAAQPKKLGGLVPRRWEAKELTPFARELWLLQPEVNEPDDETVAAMRRALGLRVPSTQRKPCVFWQQGKCRRGDACAFAHCDAGTQSKSARCPAPLRGLAHPSLPKCIGRSMLHLGLRQPSPVQAQAWPAALSGVDVLCRAPTGSGKTLAYLLPAMAHVQAQQAPLKSGQGPVALVLVPTRELAIQVLGVSRGLKKVCGVRSEAVYGGDPREEQCEMMEGVVPLLVATTGRLLDMLGTKHARLGRVTLLVLDEADQLVNLGFIDQARAAPGHRAGPCHCLAAFGPHHRSPPHPHPLPPTHPPRRRRRRRHHRLHTPDQRMRRPKLVASALPPACVRLPPAASFGALPDTTRLRLRRR